MAVGVIIAVVIVVALLIHSAQVSSANNSLKTYAGDVNTIYGKSSQGGTALLDELKGGGGASNQQALQNDADTAHLNAETYLRQVQDLSVPSAMDGAQAALVQTMQLRANGLETIASQLGGAFGGSSTATAAVNDIAQATSMLYASDVLYKTAVTPAIAKALNAAAIPIGGTTGVSINAAQVVPDLGWLDPTHISLWIGATKSIQVSKKCTASACGHDLISVSAGGTQLTAGTGGTNSMSASPAPTFVLSFTNSGHQTEYDVECKVSVGGLDDVGTATVPVTNPGDSYTCKVQLPSAPTAGLYPVTAEIVPVEGETNTSNNSMTFNITFN